MHILTIKTDQPQAEVCLYGDNERIAHLVWPAHRQLAETIHLKIKEATESRQLKLKQLDGIIVFKGPGSFTGLRIGLSVANALADSLQIPIVAIQGEDWIGQGIKKLRQGENTLIAFPEYGAPPRTTQPKH